MARVRLGQRIRSLEALRVSQALNPARLGSRHRKRLNTLAPAGSTEATAFASQLRQRNLQHHVSLFGTTVTLLLFLLCVLGYLVGCVS